MLYEVITILVEKFHILGYGAQLPASVREVLVNDARNNFV